MSVRLSNCLIIDSLLYIHIDTSFRLFPPPVTSKASFLNLSNNGTTYPMTVSASTHLNILTELFSQCLIKTYVAITYQVDISFIVISSWAKSVT